MSAMDLAEGRRECNGVSHSRLSLTNIFVVHLTDSSTTKMTPRRNSVRSTPGLTVDENGSIVSGKLSALIKRLLPGKDYYPDRSYIFAFLLNARLFMSPAELLHKVLQLFIFEQNSKSENFEKEFRVKLFRNLMRLMVDWSEMFPYDFQSDQLKCRLKEILDLCCSVDPTLNAFRFNLQQNLVKKMAKLQMHENILARFRCEVCTKNVELTNISNGIMEKCSNPKLLAQQLTLIELDRLSVIGAEEFVYALVKKSSATKSSLISSSSSPSNAQFSFYGKSVRTIDAYISWCNQLHYFVATEICRHLKKKHRVRIIEFFIEVAKECFNMGNFNSLVAIAGAMNMNPVDRLKKTWARIDKSKLHILEHQTDPISNFSSYRSTLKAAVWRSKLTDKPCEKIVIPAFGVLFRDLYVLHDSCRNRLPDGQLNYAMFSEFAHHLNLVLYCQEIQCPFERNEFLLRYLLTTQLFSDKCLQFASYECEQAESSLDKELYKQLKMEVSCTTN